MKNLLCVLLTLLISQRVVAQDYTITDVSSDGETLAISPDSSSIRFNVTGRTYSLNGAATTPFTTPAEVALAGLTSIVVNTAAGNDVVNVGVFTANLPSLTLNGGTVDAQVNFNGNITFATNANLDVDLQNDDTMPGVDQITFANNTNLVLSGTDIAALKASRNVASDSGSSLETTNGNLVTEVNQQAMPTAGGYTGVNVNAATVRVSGRGILSVKGKGDTTGDIQYDIFLSFNSLISVGINGTTTVQVMGSTVLVWCKVQAEHWTSQSLLSTTIYPTSFQKLNLFYPDENYFSLV